MRIVIPDDYQDAVRRLKVDAEKRASDPRWGQRPGLLLPPCSRRKIGPPQVTKMIKRIT